MKKVLLLLLAYLLCLCSGYAQGDGGCFKINAVNGPTLETNIDFRDYNAFFFGEFHGVYGVSEIKLALIKYLNQHYGITDVFMETSYSAAYLYNAYLATGDTSLLLNPMLIYYMKKPYRDFFVKLYQYNKTLANKLKIRGMDFERIEFLKVLKLLRQQGKERPKEILPVLLYIDTVTVPEIARLHSPESYVQNQVYENIRDSVEKYKGIFREYYGTNFKVVEDIMFNENIYRKFDKRNKAMYQNMMKEIKKDGIKKFITFNGMNHGNQNYQGWKSLCYRLAHNAALKNKLVDIALLCKNCYDWQLKPEYRYAAFRGPATYRNDTVLINEIYNKYYNSACNYTLIPSDIIDNPKVKKFSKYLILMKDQLDF